MTIAREKFNLGDRVRPSPYGLRVLWKGSPTHTADTRATVIGFGRRCGMEHVIYIHRDGCAPRSNGYACDFWELAPEPKWQDASEGPSGLIPAKASVEGSRPESGASEE